MADTPVTRKSAASDAMDNQQKTRAQVVEEAYQSIDRSRASGEMFPSKDKIRQVAEDVNAPLADRSRAIEIEDEVERSVAERAASELSAKAERYLTQSENAKKINERLAQRGVDSSKFAVIPKPEEVGLTSQQLLDYQSQVNKELATTDTSPTKIQSSQTNQVIDDQNEMQQIQAQALKDQERAMAAQTGAMTAQANHQSNMQQKMDEQIRLVEDQQKTLDTIDPERFWKSRTAAQSVMGAIGVLFSGLNPNGTNKALDVINNAIKNDIDAQKTTNENKLALQQNALKRVQLQIEKFSALSQDSQRQAQAAQLYSELGAKRAELAQQQVKIKMRNALSTSNGLDMETLRSISDEKEIERAVPLPNGKFVISSAPKELVEKVRDDIVKETPLLAGMKNLMDFSRSYNKLDLRDRAAMDTKIKLTVGNIKKLVGESGAMTERDREFILSAIGDPNFTLDIIQQPKFRAIIDTLKSKQEAKYQSIGVKIPKTREDVLRSELEKKGYTDAQIDKALSSK